MLITKLFQPGSASQSGQGPSRSGDGDEKRIRPKSHLGGPHNVAQIRSPGQYCGQKTEPTEILSGKPDQVSPGLATGDGFQSGVPRHGAITGGQVRPAGTSMRPPPRARRQRCESKSDPGRTKRKLPMPVALSSSYLLGPLIRIWAQSCPVPATLGDAPRNEKRIRPRSYSRDESTSPEPGRLTKSADRKRKGPRFCPRTRARCFQA
ncbi:hypothetical protein ACLKA6_002608 [Drosophila palustris]